MIARGLLNCFARGLFQFFLVFTWILILNSFFCNDSPDYLPHHHFCLLWNYTSIIDINICNVFKMCSDLFRIRCRSFWLFMTTTNMFSYVSVYGTYLFYLRFYISTISFILLMVIPCASHARSYVEYKKCWPHSYIKTYLSHDFTFFSDMLKVFYSPLL